MGNIITRLECCRRSKFAVDVATKNIFDLRQIPDSRFELCQFHEPEASKAKGRKMTARYGNFIDDVWSFDNEFFNISAREAKS